MSFAVFDWKRSAGVSSENLPSSSSNAASSGRSEDKRVTRRSHNKSKRGCSTCKRRHIRCDENVPRCFNCAKGDRPCVYETQESNDRNKGMALTREFSTGSLDPYGTSLVHLTPSMREQLNYCKEQDFKHSILRFVVHSFDRRYHSQITWLNKWSSSA